MIISVCTDYKQLQLQHLFIHTRHHLLSIFSISVSTSPSAALSSVRTTTRSIHIIQCDGGAAEASLVCHMSELLVYLTKEGLIWQLVQHKL